MEEFRSAVYLWPLHSDKNPRLGQKLRRRREVILQKISYECQKSRELLIQRLQAIDRKLWQLTGHIVQDFRPNRIGGNILEHAQNDISELPDNLDVFTYPFDRLHSTNRTMNERNLEISRGLIASEYRQRLRTWTDDQHTWDERGNEFIDQLELHESKNL